MFWMIPVCLIIAILYIINNKVKYTTLRNNSERIDAEVVEYRREKGPVRGDFTLLNYPYVRIYLKGGGYIIKKLSYADNYSKPFEIGEQVPVFWNEDYLLYWSTYDIGFYKYFPDNWKFLKL